MKFQLINNDYVKSNIEFTRWQLTQEEIKPIENLVGLLGKGLAEKLLKEAGSLKKLALMRPETIYKLGSKKFFSSNMRKVSAGIIALHPDFETNKDLAKQVSIAARKDFFR